MRPLKGTAGILSSQSVLIHPTLYFCDYPTTPFNRTRIASS